MIHKDSMGQYSILKNAMVINDDKCTLTRGRWTVRTHHAGADLDFFPNRRP